MTIQKQLVIGAMLIIFGIGFFTLQFLGDMAQSTIIFFIGTAFIIGYAFSRNYGLLIPGGILLGVGLGTVGEQSTLSFAGIEAISLGLGFASIYIVHGGCHDKSHWWPLIPAVALIISGLASGSVTMGQIWVISWPLILVVGGAMILVRAYQDMLSSAV